MSGEFVHRLWTVSAVFPVTITAVCLADAAPAVRRLRRRRRLAALSAAGVGGRVPWRAVRAVRRLPVRDAAVRAGVAAGTVALGAVLVGGPVGWLLGLAAAYGLWRFLSARGGRADQVRRSYRNKCLKPGHSDADSRVTEQLPIIAELLAACLAAGSGPCEAAGAVGGSVGGPLGERLVRASAELRLGGDPAAVWGRLAELPGTAALARCLERAGTTGVPAVEPVGRLAAECRARCARTAMERARRAAVLVTGPLGLCFLPAFLLAGVVPVVIGLARSLL